MSPERFRQIEELYHAVREGTAEGRAALLAGTDPELRREVELLLSQQASGGFLDRPAIEHAGELFGDSTVTRFDAGTCLGPYRVESKLGEGGMGEVFRAVDTRLGRPVAIKFTRQQFSARFEREARAIASLNHPNICTLYDIGPNYLVMELLEGDTMAARLKNGPLPIDQALSYASQIAAALADAHEHGIVHRDLKPGNVMLVKSGVKVLDFGLATWEGDDTLTGSRMVIGTPAYMAPEQREGKPADVRTDLYSFGCVLYEMVTGTRATERRKTLPSRTLEKIVSRCLATDPAQRWQTAVELRNALEAAVPVERSRIWRVAAAAFLMTLFAAGYLFFRAAPKLTDKDTIVLADFVNHTADPIFDGTLREGLAIQLEQSPFLKTMDDEQVERVLRLMSLPPGTRVTNPIAHEICVREGGAATIDGTIASIGKSYVISLQAVACQDGGTLARAQIQAEDKEHVLKAVGSAATAMRAKLGESRNSIQKLNRPLEEATTPSLEALQSYTAARSELGQGHFLAAVPLFERAIAIDPNFAMAYSFLAGAYYTAGDIARYRQNVKQAFRLIDRVSEYERDLIVPYYYESTGELDKAIDAYQLGARNYPRFPGIPNELGLLYVDMGRYEEGLREGLEAARLDALGYAGDAPYRRQLDALICLDRLREAGQLAERLKAQGLDTTRIHQRFLEMAFVEDDRPAISKEIQWFAGKPEEYISFGLQAADRNVHGQRRESRKLYQRAAEIALRRGLQSVASELDEADARADALVGNCQTVRRLGRPALALGLCGGAAQAEKLAAETSKLFPNGTIWNAVQLPGIRAAIAINRDPSRSVELLTAASPYERSYLEAIYLRGLGYLGLHKGAEAATEFRKIVDHKGANWGATWIHPWWGQFYSLSYLGVARGSALAGDVVRAKKAFDDFFELWRDADPDIPILKQAKAEYAAL